MEQGSLAQKVDFDQEEIFLSDALKSQENGPVNSFRPDNKADIRAVALDTGRIEGDFQLCGPFSNSQQKKIRQELVTTKAIINIFGDTLVADIDGLKPTEQAFRLYADRVMNEAVLVEAARRASLSARGEGSDNIDSCKQMMRESMGELYPVADRELALDALGLFHGRVNSLMENDLTSGFAIDVLAKFPFITEAAGRTPQTLSESRQQEIKGYLKDKFSPIFRRVREEIGEIDNDNMTAATKRTMDLLGYSQRGWKTEHVGSRRVGFYVDPANKLVEVGDRAKQISWQVFEKLIIHEVGVHVGRAAEAYSRGFNMAAMGWPGYEAGEEGLAILLEKTWDEKAADSSAIDRDHYRYIVGAYQSGAIDGQYHSADEAFQLAVRLSMVSRASGALKKQQPLDFRKAELEARKSMFEHVFRFNRGMPDGLVMVKDIVYFDGYSKMVKLFNESDKPAKELLDELMRGKYNPFIPLHLKVINGLYGDTD